MATGEILTQYIPHKVSFYSFGQQNFHSYFLCHCLSLVPKVVVVVESKGL